MRMRLVFWAVGAAVIVVAALLMWPTNGETRPYVSQTKEHNFKLTVEPLKQGANSLDLEITDHSGRPAVADSVTVEPAMPQMGHAVSPIVAGPRQPGHYQVANVDLPMAGQWEITVSLHRTAGTEQVVFPLLLN